MVAGVALVSLDFQPEPSGSPGAHLRGLPICEAAALAVT